MSKSHPLGRGTGDVDSIKMTVEKIQDSLKQKDSKVQGPGGLAVRRNLSCRFASSKTASTGKSLMFRSDALPLITIWPPFVDTRGSVMVMALAPSVASHKAMTLSDSTRAESSTSGPGGVAPAVDHGLSFDCKSLNGITKHLCRSS